jgi:hypothetical protein
VCFISCILSSLTCSFCREPLSPTSHPPLPLHRLHLTEASFPPLIFLIATQLTLTPNSDWNPQQDLQAQDRCHRITQTKPVIVYRLATRGTIEEDLLRSAAAKRRLEKLVIRKGNLRGMGRQIADVEAEQLDRDELRALLLRDGKVFKYTGGEEILSKEDLALLCDRYVSFSLPPSLRSPLERNG